MGDTDPTLRSVPPQEITVLRSDLDLSRAKCVLYRQLLQQLGRFGITVDYPQKPTSHHGLAKAAATVAGAMR